MQTNGVDNRSSRSNGDEPPADTISTIRRRITIESQKRANLHFGREVWELF